MFEPGILDLASYLICELDALASGSFSCYSLQAENLGKMGRDGNGGGGGMQSAQARQGFGAHHPRLNNHVHVHSWCDSDVRDIEAT